jgi:hypothetical protein
MTVGPESEDLKVDPSGRLDPVFVSLAGEGNIGSQSVREKDPIGVDVDAGEQPGLHIGVIGRGMIGAQADVFVEVERRDPAEIEALGAMDFDQTFVSFERGLAGGEPQDGVRFLADEDGDLPGGQSARGVSVGFDDDFHGMRSL